jgi:hypothetical protein
MVRLLEENICFATLVCLRMRMPQITLEATGCPHPPNTDAKPLLTGQGDTDYLCGNCDQVIAEKIEKGQINRVSVECPACGVSNCLSIIFETDILRIDPLF